jgi:hypothetical protein
VAKVPADTPRKDDHPEKGPQKRSTPAEDEVRLSDSLSEAGSTMAAQLVKAAGATVGETASLLPFMPPTPMGMPESLSQPLGPSAAPFREAGAEVSAGLGPVADSAKRAFGMFLRDLPVGGEDKPS